MRLGEGEPELGKVTLKSLIKAPMACHTYSGLACHHVPHVGYEQRPLSSLTLHQLSGPWLPLLSAFLCSEPLADVKRAQKSMDATEGMFK